MDYRTAGAILESRDLTAEIARFLVAAGLSFQITTKSAEIVDLLPDLSRARDSFYLQMSIDVPSSEESLRRILAPTASPIRKRLEALKRFHEAGIFTVARLDALVFGLTTEEEPLLAVLDTLSGYTDHVVCSTLPLGAIEAARLKRALRTLPDGEALIASLDQHYTDRGAGSKYVNLEREKRERFHR